MTDINDARDDARPAPQLDPENGKPATAPSATASTHPSGGTGSHEHPGIVLRPGPTGPRAALLDGPDIWEVIAALHALREEDPTRDSEVLQRELRVVTGLSTAQVSAALDYYAAHRDSVDERIASNTTAAERAQRPPTAG